MVLYLIRHFSVLFGHSNLIWLFSTRSLGLSFSREIDWIDQNTKGGEYTYNHMPLNCLNNFNNYVLSEQSFPSLSRTTRVVKHFFYFNRAVKHVFFFHDNKSRKINFPQIICAIIIYHRELKVEKLWHTVRFRQLTASVILCFRA
jgi:hypothetical protein